MPLNMHEVEDYVNKNIIKFHEGKISAVKKLKLNDLLKKKNPYLFRAKNILTAQEMIEELMAARISSSEEKIFGDFLEGLAIFVAKEYGARKSTGEGIDLEMIKNGVHYLVSVKSGGNWGNSSSEKKLLENFNRAKKVVKQSVHGMNIISVLGICYGSNTSEDFRETHTKYVGQKFWHFLSNDKDLYKEIVIPIGYEAKKHNDAFIKQHALLINKFTAEFLNRFCDSDGAIKWQELVEFNSGNIV